MSQCRRQLTSGVLGGGQGSPFITVSGAARAVGMTFPTAQNNVNKLVEAGILREMTGRTTNRIYVADEILRLLDAPTTDAEG